MIKQIASINALILPNQLGLARSAPRPPAQQQPNYLQQFDQYTLFYDAFQQAQQITLSGPPLRNLKQHIHGQLQLNDQSIPADQIQLNDLYKIQDSHIKHPAPSNETPQTLSLKIHNQRISTSISPTHTDWFAGRRVLLTLSQDNPLIWIIDWVRHHIQHHQINAVLIYDNASQAYMPQALLQAISSVAGLDTVVVVPWNFPYGPQGGSWAGPAEAPIPWDSDYTQYGALEHAHHRFLSQAQGVINADIDELLICEDGGSVFDYMQRQGHSGICYQGRWIENTGPDIPPSTPRYSHYSYYNPQRPRSKPKWTLLPAQLKHNTRWEVHAIHNQPLPDVTADVAHRHFMAISLHWKTDRSPRLPYHPNSYRQDNVLLNALATQTKTQQTDRLTALQTALQHPQHGQTLSNRLRYATFIGKDKNYLYVETPKAACTTLKWILAQLENCPIPRNHSGRMSTHSMVVHQRHRYPIANLIDLIAQQPAAAETLLNAPDIIRFCIVRNPYARIVSAWADKIRQKEPTHAHLWASINNHTQQPKENCPSFSEFLHWLTHTQNVDTCDPHWRSMVNLLQPHLLHYTHVLRSETLSSDLQPLLDKLYPAQNAAELLAQHRHNVSLPIEWRSYYTPDIAAIVAHRYQEDFTHYGYDKNSWQQPQPPAVTQQTLQQRYHQLEQTALTALRARNQVIAELTEKA